MSRPFPSRHAPSGPNLRINGKIRAREVRVIGDDSQQLGVMALAEALNLARTRGVDLVEIAPNAVPPVCRLVEYGKFKYEQEKRQKEGRKHQHANKVKEIQLSATIDPHDFQTKLTHAVDFLCEDMKVKAALRFRGREMAHTEFGFQVVKRFLAEIAPWGHPDFDPKLNGRSINVMISPLPRNKRAKHPGEVPGGPAKPAKAEADAAAPAAPATGSAGPKSGESAGAGARSGGGASPNSSRGPSSGSSKSGGAAGGSGPGGFANNPFEGLDIGSKS